MKINEAVDIINGTDTLQARYIEHKIDVCYKLVPFNEDDRILAFWDWTFSLTN